MTVRTVMLLSFCFSDGDKERIPEQKDDQVDVEDGKDGQKHHQQDVIGFEFEDKESGVSGDGSAEKASDEQF